MAEPLNKTRILVADDERPIADSLTRILEQSGYEVRTAYSGEDAITCASSFRPDIVIADYCMPPGINGIDTCMRIKRLLPGVRAIMLSAHPLESLFGAPQSQGYNFLLLAKPIHPSDLLKRIHSEDVRRAFGVERLKLLNVDDSEEHRYSMSRLFARAGFEVSEAATGAEALRRALESKPDVILLDIHLPDCDGFQVCDRLKHNPETAQITVVHVTASAQDANSATRSRQVGADAYFVYPIVPNDLMKQVRELLQMRFLSGE